MFSVAAAVDRFHVDDNGCVLVPLSGAELSVEQIPKLATLQLIVGDHQLVVEFPAACVTETGYVTEVLDQLRRHGIGIAYGACRRLDFRKPPDFVRLPVSLIATLALESDSFSRVEALIRQAHEVNCRVIAPELRSQEDVQRLTDLGCDWGVGPIFGTATGVKPTTDHLYFAETDTDTC